MSMFCVFQVLTLDHLKRSKELIDAF